MWIFADANWNILDVLTFPKLASRIFLLDTTQVIQEHLNEPMSSAAAWRMLGRSPFLELHPDFPVVPVGMIELTKVGISPGEGRLPRLVFTAELRSVCVCLCPSQALRCLKAKRRTERRIEELHSKLDAVQGILDRIYASQTDQMVPWAPALCSSSPSSHPFLPLRGGIYPGNIPLDKAPSISQCFFK